MADSTHSKTQANSEAHNGEDESEPAMEPLIADEIDYKLDELQSYQFGKLCLQEWPIKLFREQGLQNSVERILGISLSDNPQSLAAPDLSREPTVSEQRYLFNQFNYYVENSRTGTVSYLPDKMHRMRLQWIADAINVMIEKNRKRLKLERSESRVEPAGKGRRKYPNWLENHTGSEELIPPLHETELWGRWNFVDERIHLVGHILGLCKHSEDAETFFRLLCKLGQTSAINGLYNILLYYEYIFEKEPPPPAPSLTEQLSVPISMLDSSSSRNLWQIALASLSLTDTDDSNSSGGEKKVSQPEDAQPPQARRTSTSLLAARKPSSSKAVKPFVPLKDLEEIREAFMSHKCNILEKKVTPTQLERRYKEAEETAGRSRN